jgi:hypothetical protein
MQRYHDSLAQPSGQHDEAQPPSIFTLRGTDEVVVLGGGDGDAAMDVAQPSEPSWEEVESGLSQDWSPSGQEYDHMQVASTARTPGAGSGKGMALVGEWNRPRPTAARRTLSPNKIQPSAQRPRAAGTRPVGPDESELPRPGPGIRAPAKAHPIVRPSSAQPIPAQPFLTRSAEPPELTARVQLEIEPTNPFGCPARTEHNWRIVKAQLQEKLRFGAIKVELDPRAPRRKWIHLPLKMMCWGSPLDAPFREQATFFFAPQVVFHGMFFQNCSSFVNFCFFAPASFPPSALSPSHPPPPPPASSLLPVRFGTGTGWQFASAVSLPSPTGGSGWLCRAPKTSQIPCFTGQPHEHIYIYNYTGNTYIGFTVFKFAGLL